MAGKSSSPQTPLTSRADRSRRDVRLFEEAVLALRGRWPATATGLCMSVNALFGFRLGDSVAQERIFRTRVEEALRLLEALEGAAAVERVRRWSATDGGGRSTALTRRRHLRAA